MCHVTAAHPFHNQGPENVVKLAPGATLITDVSSQGRLFMLQQRRVGFSSFIFA